MGVLGATGTVGARIVRLLEEHPWFRLREVAASPGSAGRRLAEGVPPGTPLLAESARMELMDPEGPWSSHLILSSLPSAAARDHEVRLAEEGHLVVSNASAHRMDPDVPLLIPEVNPDHLDLLDRQAERWSGGLITNPNCSVGGLALVLAPLHRHFGVERVVVSTYQAISGAGRPGPSAGELTDNVLPLIPGEEEKLSTEPRKILGTLGEGGLEEARFRIAAHCARVPVLDGHLESVSVGLTRKASPEEVAEVLSNFRGEVADEGLPSSPARPVRVTEEPDRPQPRLDREAGHAMTVTVGRIRPCEVLDVKLFLLSHNLGRGAAGAAVLNAELCRVRGRTP